MSALLAQAQQMQQHLLAAQQRLIDSEVHGEAGGGLVKVTVKGSGEVVAIDIDPKVVDPEDVETLQDHAVSPLYQRQMVARSPCRASFTLDTDHSPFLSCPDDLAALALPIAAAVG